MSTLPGLLDFHTFCPRCSTSRPTYIAGKEDVSPYGHLCCSHCHTVLWTPIAWDADGNTCGWSSQERFTFWREVPPEDKFTCASCGFSWLRAEGTVCRCCGAPAHE
jgi:hypothetical protein